MEQELTALFQRKVGELLVRNKSILDIITKFQVANSRANRRIMKAVTACGCIAVDGRKSDWGFDNRRADSQISGNLCEECRSAVESEIGENLFYLASLCNALDIRMEHVLRSELERMEVLGKYSLK